MAEKEGLRPYPYVSSRLALTIISALFFYAVIFLSGSFSGGGTNPAIWFFAPLAMATIVGVGTGALSDKDTTQVTLGAWGYNLGNQPASIAQFLIGIGVGTMFFTGFSRPATVLSQGSNFFTDTFGAATVAAAGQPLYMPLSTDPEFQIAFAGLAVTFGATMVGGAIYYGVVAFFEEALSVVWHKNITNNLVMNTYKLGIPFTNYTFYTIDLGLPVAGMVGLLVGAGMIWGVGHFSSWPMFGAASLFMLVFYRFIFWSGYLIVDNIGLVSPSKALDWRNFVVWGGASSHFTWDFLIHLQDHGLLVEVFFLPVNMTYQGLIGGALLIILPLIWLYNKRKNVI